jgi:fatty acid desaturase
LPHVAWYLQTVVKPVVSPRWASYQRNVYFAGLFLTLTYLPMLTGERCLTYFTLYSVLWVVALFATFAFFMILREDIQHSNTARQKFRDTRNFEGNPLVKWSLFPLNMDYHLVHHIFPLVPHYNLPKLERLPLETEVYRRCRILVKGYLLPHRDAQRDRVRPTAADSSLGEPARRRSPRPAERTPVGAK